MARNSTVRSGGPEALAALSVLLIWVSSAKGESDQKAAAGAADPYTVEAPRFAQAPVIDGKLDDAVWKGALVLNRFIQLDTHQGAPISERTEVRIGYDAQNLYVGFRCFDSQIAALVGTVMQRDGNLAADDHVEIHLDTFHDRRDGFLFETNSLGAQVDAAIRADGEEIKWQWDGAWTVATSRDAEGWTAEFAIPFSTLRFPSTEPLVFGLNVARFIARTKELAFWKPLSYSMGAQPRYKVSQYGDITGFHDLEKRGSLEIVPHATLGGLGVGNLNLWPVHEGGVDAKLRLSSNFVADLTVNPDFAEAEADQLQLNTTPYRLLLPEKREFFKEGASLLYFGDRQVQPYEVFERFSFFESRTIGLASDAQQTVPILGGGRVTGKLGPVSVGALNVTTEPVTNAATGLNEPATNYTVVRAKADLFGPSSLGVIALNKQQIDGDGYNRGVGTDANVVFNDHLRAGGFLAQTYSPGLNGDDVAASGDVLWESQNFRFQGLYSDIGQNFNPEMGYLTRSGIRKFQIKPVVTVFPGVWQFDRIYFNYDFNFVMDRVGDLETRLQKAEIGGLLKNGAGMAILATDDYERITADFALYKNVTIPAGSYHFHDLFIGLITDPSRPVSPAIWLDYGQFWGGTRLRTRFFLTWRPRPGFELDLDYDRQRIQLPWGDFTAQIFSGVASYSFSRTLRAQATLLFSSDDNVRGNLLLDWNYLPGADVFLVYDERRDLLGGRPWLNSRKVELKITYRWGL